LIDNATDAATTRVTVRTMVENGAVVVEVADDGPGVPAELRDRIWEPFFTTKAVGQGTGLGLDIARRLIEQHGGELTLSSVPGNTRFRARLPAADPRATLAARPVSPAAHTS
jgi:signal transduction histidine kinase